MYHSADGSRVRFVALAWLTSLYTNGFAIIATAQDASWVGKTLVMTHDKVELKIVDPVTGQNKVIGVVHEADVRADSIQGEWVWVRTSSQEGWITKGDAVPADQAVSYFSNRIQQNPNDVFAYNQRSMAFVSRNELDKALADISEAIRLAPQRPAMLHNRGLIWHRKQEYQKALADYDESLRLDSAYALAYRHRGECYVRLGEHDKALSDFTEAIRLVPSDAVACSQRGWVWFEKANYDQALADFSEAIRLDAKLDGAFRGRAKVFQFRKEYDKAIADFDQALSLSPSWGVVHSERGWSWFEKKQFDKALADFNAALRIDPGIVYAYEGRGRSYQSQKNHDAALADLNEFIRRTPRMALGYLDRGWLRFEMKQYEQGLSDFNEALQVDPNSAFAHRGRGRCYYALKDYDRALAECHEVIEKLPAWSYGYKDRGEVWYALKDFNQAIEDYSSAIRIDPDYAEALRSRALAWRANRDFERALADINAARRLAPADWTMIAQRANIFRLSKQYGLAISDFNTVLEMNPGNAGIIATRGYTHYQNKAYDEALADFDQANQLDPKAGWAYRNRAMLLAACPDDRYRNAVRAREQLAIAQQLLPPAADVYEAQAAVAAESGDFDEAVRWQLRVLEDPAWRLNPDMQARLEVYRNKQPYREGMDLTGFARASNAVPPSAPVVVAPASPPATGFISLFDGNSLNGWTGNPKYWSAANGVLHGKVTDRATGSAFLVWNGTAGDFELQLKFRLLKGNSGIQFRSADLGNEVVAGYQADIGHHDTRGVGITGRLFDEKIRKDGFLGTQPGQVLAIDSSGIVRILGSTATPDELARLATIAEPASPLWHDYHILAQGQQMVLTVDGVVTTRLTDSDPRVRKSGIIAIQLWGNSDIEIRDVHLKHLNQGQAVATTGPALVAKPPATVESATLPNPPVTGGDLLRGAWVCVLTLKDGDAVDDYVGVRAVIDGDNLTWLFPEQDGKYREQKNKLRIDPSQNPKHFDSWPIDKPESLDLRIYSVSDSVLRWATNLDGKTRPATFDAGRWQFTMKRVVAAGVNKGTTGP